MKLPIPGIAGVLQWAIQYWYLIAIAILSGALFFTFSQWQFAREDVGAYRTKVQQEQAYSRGLEGKLREANKSLDDYSRASTQSYNACQELARTNVGQAFDRGVQFGRATCPKPIVPLKP